MPRQAKSWFDKQTGWWTVWLNGKRVRLAEGRKNRRAAREKLQDLQHQARANPLPACGEQTVASVIEAYLAHATGRIADSTLAVRKPYLQSFAEHCGPQTMPQCSPEDLEAWLELHPEWVSDWTKNGAVRTVQGAFNWAVSRKVTRDERKVPLIRENPFRGFTHRPGEARRDMTLEEFRAILRTTGPIREQEVRRPHKKRPTWKKPTPGARFRQILLYLWLTGCRPAEAAKLTWANVDLDAGFVRLKQHKTSRMQKVPVPRVIPLDPVLLRLLRSIRERSEGAYVFLTHRRTPWTKNSLAQRVRRAREVAGVSDDAKLYGTRHAFGCRGILNGCDIKSLSVLMGHTTVRMTEHYVHLATQHQHLAASMQLVNGRRRDA
jgi:integrase